MAYFKWSIIPSRVSYIFFSDILYKHNKAINVKIRFFSLDIINNNLTFVWLKYGQNTVNLMS